MTDLVDTTEMYLRTVLDLEEEGIVPMRARLAERLEQSGPTVSQTVGRMERDGLIVVTADDRHLELTPKGRERAGRVLRKHRLAERLLADVIGLDWEYIHEEACRWEHVMSERVERRIAEMLDNPGESPYGNPIPGLQEFGMSPSAPFLAGVTSIVAACSATGQCVGVLRRIAEPAQFVPEVLASFREVGLVPGATVSARYEGDQYRVSATGGDGALDLDRTLAAHLFVAVSADE